jgi:hypothetical protein
MSPALRNPRSNALGPRRLTTRVSLLGVVMMLAWASAQAGCQGPWYLGTAPGAVRGPDGSIAGDTAPAGDGQSGGVDGLAAGDGSDVPASADGSASGDGTAADLGPAGDARVADVAPSPGTVACASPADGGASCPVPSQVCCYATLDVTGGSCTPAGACQGNAAACDGPDDCPTGQRCCSDTSGFVTTCSAQCPPLQEVCGGGSQCPGGLQCRLIDPQRPYAVCQ